MSTYPVPATVEADESPVYVAVAAELEVCGSCNGHDIARSGDVGSSCYSCNGGANEVPPSVLVALLDPCETCGGDPSAEDHRCAKSMVVPGLDIRRPGQHCDCSFENDLCHWCGIEWLADGEYRCRHCDNHGSKLVTLQRECTHPHEELGCVGLPSCDRNGIVSLPGLYRLTKLVTILAEDDPSPFPPGPAYVRVNRSGRTFFLSPYTSQEVTVHGTPETGGYVAMFEKVDA